VSEAGRARRPLGSTYRLQLSGFGFTRAAALVDYLHELGVETLYASPVLAAVPGSTHGYDVIDPTRLDPALGDQASFDRLLAALARHDMRLLIDIVPNHMATHPDNAWWWDVLRRGQASADAETFDIDWAAHGGKVLVPTLAEPLGEVLDRNDVELGPDRGEPTVVVGGQRFPLDPESARTVRAARGRREWEALLARQHFRPAFWRLSRDEGNYRRFFDIDGLIGVRVEDPRVYEASHRFLLELAEDDRIAGWRVDHVDGLVDPGAYLARLRGDLGRARPAPSVLLVEKILAKDESLVPDWEVDGTTGYEFADAAGGLFVDPVGAAAMEEAGGRLAGQPDTFAELALTAKREVLRQSFPAPLRRLVRLASAALEQELPGHDLSEAELEEAIGELTVHLDAYRTYITAAPVDGRDRARLRRAADAVGPNLSAEGRRALDIVCGRLTGERAGPEGSTPAVPWVEFAQRWQQLSGAVTAKGVEDTATYRFSGLLSHADVGGDPAHPAVSAPDFHKAMAARGRRYPSSLNATSTHDSKRSEDVRSRLFALSEVPDEWTGLVTRWHRRYVPVLARSGGPDGHDELVAYQTLAGVWPIGRSQLSTDQCRRVQDYMVKMAREAKRRTGWTDPDERYERSLRTFVRRLARSPHDPFAREIRRLVGRIGPAAATNSLALSVLKSVCPGVPDLYQGNELWDFSLTDPDNRRPVDFSLRRQLLSGLPAVDEPPAARAAAAGTLLKAWPDGRIKLHLLRTLLTLRRDDPALFDGGSFQLLTTRGASRQHVVGLARHHRGAWIIAFVPRLTLNRAGPGRFPTGSRVWGDTTVQLPREAPTHFTDVLTGATLSPHGRSLDAARIFALLPVSVLQGGTK
jgi:(1->4)-alpha-D-glucan 1-alpha-D-glucosylmutase